MMTKITVKGKYTGSNKRGIIVGGAHFTNNGQTHTALVDERCYNSLLAGEKSGWFKIVEDNYERFCISRMRPVPVRGNVAEVEIADEITHEVVVETPAEEVVETPAEEVVETPAEEVAPPKKKASTKKKA